jgi:AcrR family transcriptional regulator
MVRPSNPERPAKLLDAVIAYLVKNGVANLSLRPLAKAVGSSNRGLLYHFGSKEGIVDKAFALLRERQRAAYETLIPASFVPPSAGCREIWRALTMPESERQFKLFFETYSLALRRPRRFADFLHNTIEDWLEFVAEPMRREGYTNDNARAFGTVMLAGFRGFLLDYCASHDRKRLDCALDMWLHGLDAMYLLRGRPL